MSEHAAVARPKQDLRSGSRRRVRRSLVTRWLGAGLATLLSVTTLVLALTGRLTLYIAPETVWFASAAAVVTIIGTVWTFTLPLGAEDDHDHDHGEPDPSTRPAAQALLRTSGAVKRLLARTGIAIAGAAASVFVVLALVLPPASLSVDLAMSRDTGAGTLFAGSDNVTLGQADTSTFGIGDWSTVFASATRPENYDGEQVTLTGFVTPSGENPDEMRLTRMVITHCVIDAQPAAVPVTVDVWEGDWAVGDWVEVEGTVRVSADGSLAIEPSSVVAVPEPGDPYEY